MRPKQIWYAILLTIIFGPIGLSYCTLTGAVVMTIVSIALGFWLGFLSYFLVLPACIPWAWLAARESASMFD